jgi:hypothetical protein
VETAVQRAAAFDLMVAASATVMESLMAIAEQSLLQTRRPVLLAPARLQATRGIAPDGAVGISGTGRPAALKAAAALRASRSALAEAMAHSGSGPLRVDADHSHPGPV